MTVKGIFRVYYVAKPPLDPVKSLISGGFQRPPPPLDKIKNVKPPDK